MPPPPPTTAAPDAPAPLNVYAFTGPSDLAAATAGVPARVYVPNSASNTVDVIDQTTMQVVGHFAVDEEPQHVTPAWDLRTLYVDNDRGNSLTPIDPRTGAPSGPPIPVEDPYNLYFTPNGQFAIVVAERLERLDFRDPNTMALRTSTHVPCHGVDHMDFSADGTTRAGKLRVFRASSRWWTSFMRASRRRSISRGRARARRT